MICNIRKWTSCAPTHALWHVSHNCKKFRWWCGLDDYQSRAVTPLYYPSGMASWRQDNKEKGKCHAVGSRLTGAECLALLLGASRIRCRSEGTWMVSTLSRRWRARPSTLLASACGRRSAVHVDKAVDGVRVVYVSIARYLSIADKFLYQFVTSPQPPWSSCQWYKTFLKIDKDASMDGRHRRWFGDGHNLGETLLEKTYGRTGDGQGSIDKAFSLCSS